MTMILEEEDSERMNNSKAEAIQVNQEFESNINELLQLRTATRQAMEVFMKLQ